MNDAPWWIREPPPKPEEGIKFVIQQKAMLMLIEDRRYRVYTCFDLISPQLLRVVLLAYSEDNQHVDSFDLYDLSDRREFILEAARETQIPVLELESDLGILVRELEHHRDAFLEHLCNVKAQQPPHAIH